MERGNIFFSRRYDGFFSTAYDLSSKQHCKEIKKINPDNGCKLGKLGVKFAMGSEKETKVPERTHERQINVMLSRLSRMCGTQVSKRTMLQHPDAVIYVTNIQTNNQMLDS